MTQTRRQFIQVASGLTALATGLTLPGVSMAQTVDEDALLQPGAKGDKIIGAEDAPVTVVEYASMTCGHCANFHSRTYPDLKKEYIETGKVRFIFREFALDTVAAAAFMLARCAPDEKYFDVIDVMFAQQRNWAFSENPVQSLLEFSKQIGFTQESFEACLTDQELYAAVDGSKNRAASEFGVRSTPTFFVNGEMHPGALSIEEFRDIIDKHL